MLVLSTFATTIPPLSSSTPSLALFLSVHQTPIIASCCNDQEGYEIPFARRSIALPIHQVACLNQCGSQRNSNSGVPIAWRTLVVQVRSHRRSGVILKMSWP
jgi:hypothetical protein